VIWNQVVNIVGMVVSIVGIITFPYTRQHELRLTLRFAVNDDVVCVAFKRLFRMMLLHPPIKYNM
jgi:hypothetical protein